MADITDARLTALLQYCHLDDMADNAVVTAAITTLYSAAVEYMTAAGITRGDDNGTRYDLAVNALVLNWYDNRGAGGDKTLTEYPIGLRALIDQLKPVAF